MADNAITERHMKFMQSRGYHPESVADVEKFVGNMSADMRERFFADFAAWKEPEPAAAAAEGVADDVSDHGQTFKVLRHLQHNETMHKPGAMVRESMFTPEQLKVLLGTGTIEEVAVKGEEEAEEKK